MHFNGNGKRRNRDEYMGFGSSELYFFNGRSDGSMVGRYLGDYLSWARSNDGNESDNQHNENEIRR